MLGFSWHSFFQVYWDVSSLFILTLISYLTWRNLVKDKSSLTLEGISRSKFLFLCSTGLVVRLIVAPFLSHSGDTTNFLLAGYYITQKIGPWYMALTSYHGPTIPIWLSGAEEVRWYVGYPLTWTLMCGVSYLLADLIAPGNLFVYVFAIKLWIIVADFAVAYLLYRIVSRAKGANLGYEIAAFYLICPFTIFIGVLWGQINVLTLLTTLIAVLLFIEKNYLLSGIALGSGIAIKYHPIIFVPIFLLALKKRKNQFLYLGSVMASSLVLIFWPFLVWRELDLFLYLDILFTRVLSKNMELFTPYYVIYAITEISRKDSWIQGWSLLRQNPLLKGFWILPLMWLYLKWAKYTSKASHAARWEVLLPVLICVKIAFQTFVVWTTEQGIVLLFAFSLLSTYLLDPKDSDYVQVLWIVVLLHGFVNVYLGRYLLLPIWDYVKHWAIHITYQGSRYTLWMQTTIRAVLTLYFVAYNMLHFRKTLAKWSS